MAMPPHTSTYVRRAIEVQEKAQAAVEMASHQRSQKIPTMDAVLTTLPLDVATQLREMLQCVVSQVDCFADASVTLSDWLVAEAKAHQSVEHAMWIWKDSHKEQMRDLAELREALAAQQQKSQALEAHVRELETTNAHLQAALTALRNGASAVATAAAVAAVASVGTLTGAVRKAHQYLQATRTRLGGQPQPDHADHEPEEKAPAERPQRK